MPYKFLEHTADVKFEASGKTLGSVFESSGKALFATLVDIKKVEAKEARKVSVAADTPENLLHDWLAELLFLFETEGLVFSKFKASVNLKKMEATGTASGEKLRKEHALHGDVKAITYHELKVEKRNGYKATVILDV